MQFPGYPDPVFIEQTKEAFPDKGIANVEEARVLFSCDGYAWLDVRSALEVEEVGKVNGSINVPFEHVMRVWDSAESKKVVKKEPNTEFAAMVAKKFPNKATAKIMVGDSDGATYAIDALEALEDAGYENLVGIKGGYNSWFRTWDHKLNRRRADAYTEEYSSDGDSCGIHGTGAGFERMDKIESWVPPKY